MGSQNRAGEFANITQAIARISSELGVVGRSAKIGAARVCRFLDAAWAQGKGSRSELSGEADCG